MNIRIAIYLLTIFAYFLFATSFYRLQTKFGRGNVFTPALSVILFTGGGGVHPLDRHPPLPGRHIPPRWQLKRAVRILWNAFLF